MIDEKLLRRKWFGGRDTGHLSFMEAIDATMEKKYEWVKLTDGEIHTAYVEAANQTLRPQDERIALAFARAIEAKLEEKNL